MVVRTRIHLNSKALHEGMRLIRLHGENEKYIHIFHQQACSKIQVNVQGLVHIDSVVSTDLFSLLENFVGGGAVDFTVPIFAIFSLHPSISFINWLAHIV